MPAVFDAICQVAHTDSKANTEWSMMTNSTTILGMVLLISVMSVSAAGQTEHDTRMSARVVEPGGQVVLSEGDRPILLYNARTVEPPEGYIDLVHEANRKYARPRSGYIHPLFGPDGEKLTLDWSTDHPHHRGIYWAWPEVQYHGQTGDLHALQHVYSRPVGDPATTATDTFARVEARNVWLWEDEEPIVFERVTITAHARTDDGSRAIDLELRFEALDDGVTLARRETNLYGGLNTRLAPITNMQLQHHADDEGARPRRAWSLARGTWQGGKQPITLAILEHPDNPDYPGDWIYYEYLPWFQPTFPRAGTRYTLARGEPLVLRYRYLVIPGLADDQFLREAFDAYAAAGPAQSHTKQDDAHGKDGQ
jgi:hypothetical protein